jgi:hypothetical protein
MSNQYAQLHRGQEWRAALQPSRLAWWRYMGSKAYPKVQQLLILADAGSSQGSQSRLWIFSLQRLANPHRLTHPGLTFSARHQQSRSDCPHQDQSWAQDQRKTDQKALS